MKLPIKGASLYDRINHVLGGLVGAIVVLMMLLVSVDVLSRFFLHYPVKGTIEICEWAIMCIPFLGGAWLLRDDGHIKMDLLLNQLNQKPQALLYAITSMLGVMLCATFTWYVAQNAWRDYITGYYRMEVLSLPRAPFGAIMAVGFFLLVIQFLRRSYGYLMKWKSL